MKQVVAAAFAVLAATSAASAADMAPRYTKAPPPIAAIAYNWTGFYIGVNVGGGWAEDRAIVANEFDGGLPFISGTFPGFGTFGSRNASGIFGGGQIGYNWQAAGSPFVLGLEADFQGSDIKGSQIATIPYIDPANTFTYGTTEHLRWFGTVRGRVGYAWDRFMIYATGGFAFGEVRTSLAMTDTFGFDAAGTFTSTRTGYTVGAGGEYAFSPNWSLKLEYQYLDLGRRTVLVPEFDPGPTTFTVGDTQRLDYHTVRLGLNYKWGGPIVARY
jgi:outer membrane immunogenic protein